jgi:hypothetical protein
MSRTEFDREVAAAEIAVTGKRMCPTCCYPRDASTGKMVRMANGNTRWRCGCCTDKVKARKAG